MIVESLPEYVIKNLGIFGLIITGFLVEKHYVSRPAMFANGIALNVHVHGFFAPPDLLLYYADIGIIVAAVAIVSYAFEIKLPEEFYGTLGWAYSSIAVGAIILITL